MSKLIVNVKNLNGGRTHQLYVLGQETVDFVNKMETNVRGQKLEVVAKVLKTNFTSKTVIADNGVTYKVYNDKSVVEKI